MKKLFGFSRFGKPLILIAIGLFSSFIIISCGKGKNDQADSDYFSFDKSKLGMEVVDQDLGIKFYPPISWELRQTLISKKIEARDVANPGDHFIYEPTYVFFDNSSGGLLSVGKVVTNDTSLAKSSRLNYYKGLISTKHKNDKLSSSNFIHSKIYFSQFTIEKQNLFSYKLVFENNAGQIIQFDYTIPSGYLETAQPLIKSSIGSIRPQ
ncbi:MAG: hypothetical protein NTX65_00625 [Ignavibacteriales bacterium]|nr:hypothetical protein [Ignavibacteriales bacterium]